MKRLILLLALGASPAWAGQADLVWSIPRTYCDGTPMATPDGYTLLYGQKKSVLTPGTLMTHTVTGLTPGTWWFSVAATVGEETSQFATVERTVALSEFTTVGGPAFRIVNRVDRFLLVAVGSIAPGVRCNPDHSVNGNYVVPRASVTWSGTVRPDVVVAQCH